MGCRRILAVCALLGLVISLAVSDAVGQDMGSPGSSMMGPSSNQSWPAVTSASRTDYRSAASLSLGWMAAPRRIRLGYDGLVPPGACVSSYFVYPLSGVEVGGALPIRLGDRNALRLYGAYFITDTPQAGQEITWTHIPPGTREWQQSNSQWYRAGGEVLYRMTGEMALVGGFRWESLLTNFSDPNPAYVYTIPTMQAQTTVSICEPYVGVRLEQSHRPGGISLQLVGFPLMFAAIEHLNVCNNAGIPFAHTGRQNAKRGFFVEVSAEYRIGPFQGIEAAAFVDWNVYQGHCRMTIERHEGGAHPGVTAATVDWSHCMSSLVLGARVEFSWNLPL